MTRRLVRVAVNAPLRDALTYSLPSDLQPDAASLARGTSVVVPLGKRKAQGVVLGPAPDDSVDIKKVKDIFALDEERSPISASFLTWLEWVSNYYVYPVGQVVELAFAPLKEKGRKKTALAVTPSLDHVTPKVLTPEQDAAVKSILGSTGFQTHLLFGVTGSGKTEVYLTLLEKVLAAGKQGLVLVPEIALTPQLLSRFTARFGDRVAILHSQLTERDRTNQWWDVVAGRKSILIGARSALFCPLENLGLIVVDEEHESSFKQDEKLKYHARDSAVVLAQIRKCPIVLGSATPSLESWQNAVTGKYHLHRMSLRATQVALPEVQVIDLRNKVDNPDKGDPGKDEKAGAFWATPVLMAEIQNRIDRHEQVALFLNRRGLAQAVICPACGARKECPNCSITLTLHAKTHLVCHYCDYQENMTEYCTVCRDSEMKAIGLGTELVEKNLHEHFPEAQIVRADRDEIQNREELEEFIRKVESREAQILVGTQMIAKGLDFPHLTLVGVVLADIALNLPDFRASERGFQLLTQVAGRAGRQKTVGQVIIQTFNPDHPSIQFACHHDFEGFAAQELVARKELGYPPFGKLLLLRLQGLSKKAVEDSADRLAARTQQLISRSKSSEHAEVLGPAEAPIFKVRNNFRYHVLVKAAKSFNLGQLAWTLQTAEGVLSPGVRLIVDIDPLNMM